MEYTTILGPARDEFTEKRSRFIGYAAPVTTEEQALAFIQEKRSRHWDANHNVYAYILREGGIKRYSDDGEPQGTAGVPVLDVLQKEGLTDLVVVVTRYFGGILLGAGGLVRAYSHGAKLAIQAAGKKVMSPCSVLEMEFDYSLYGKVSYLLPKYRAVTLESDFGVGVYLKLLLLTDLVPALQKELDELSAGTLTPRLVQECYDCIEHPSLF